MSKADETIGAGEAAELLQITPRRLQQLAAEGWIPRGKRGQYTVGGVVQGYVRSIRDEKAKSSKSAGEDRIREMRARQLELEIAREERVLIPTEDAIAAMEEVVGMVRADLSGVPARLTRDIERRREIEQAINAVLARTAERLGKSAAALETGSEASDPDAKDEPG